MKYFALIDELFDFNYLMTEEVLQDLPKDMLDNMEEAVVSSTITSELDPAMEQHLRGERNIKLYFNILRRLEKNESLVIEDVNDIFTLINKTNKQKPEIDTLITNSLLASRLVDHPDYIQGKYSIDIPGSPYPIGTIGNIKIVVDPYMKWEDTNMIFFSKKDIKVAAYIKSANVEYQGLQSTKLVSTICAYILNKIPVDIVEVKVQSNTLI